MYGMSLPGSHTATADVNAVVLIPRPCCFTSFNVVSGSTARWIKFYDKATPPGTSDSPFLVIKTNASLHLSGGTSVPVGGIEIKNGLAIRITANAAENDDTAVSAGDVVLKYYYRSIYSPGR